MTRRETYLDWNATAPLRPESDAVSELTLTVLAAAAASERAVIVERTLDGLAVARRAGKRLGRPLGMHVPAPEPVAGLRTERMSWPMIARRLRCTVGSARRALRGALSQGVARGRGLGPSTLGMAERHCRKRSVAAGKAPSRASTTSRTWSTRASWT